MTANSTTPDFMWKNAKRIDPIFIFKYTLDGKTITEGYFDEEIIRAILKAIKKIKNNLIKYDKP